MNYSPGPQGFFHDSSLFYWILLVTTLMVMGSGWPQSKTLWSLVSFCRPGGNCESWCGPRLRGPTYCSAGFIPWDSSTRSRRSETWASLRGSGRLLFPFLLVVLSIPLSPKGEEPQFEWELRRGERLRRRRAGESATPVPTSGGLPSGPRPRMFRPTSLPVRQPVRASAGPAPPEDPAGDPESPTTDPPPPTD